MGMTPDLLVLSRASSLASQHPQVLHAPDLGIASDEGLNDWLFSGLCGYKKNQ